MYSVQIIIIQHKILGWACPLPQSIDIQYTLSMCTYIITLDNNINMYYL
jgi:hypothetical protein